jgi:hypothetical protein
MKKKLLLALAMLLTLGMIFTTCSTDDTEDDVPPPPVVIDPPPPPPPPPPPAPVPHAPSSAELVGVWDSLSFSPEDELLVRYTNRLAKRTDADTRFANQMIHIEHRIKDLSLDEDLKLKLTVNTTMTITSATNTWTLWTTARGYIINNWPGGVTPQYTPTTTTPGTAGQFTITAKETVEKQLTWKEATDLQTNGIVSVDGKELKFKTAEALKLYYRFDVVDPDYELVLIKQGFDAPEPDEYGDYKIPTMADLQGIWYTEFTRPVETVREFLERKGKWTDTATALRDMRVRTTQYITMEIESGVSERHIDTTLTILPTSDNSYPYYSTFRDNLVNGWDPWNAICLIASCTHDILEPADNDSEHTVRGFEDFRVEDFSARLATLTAGETGDGMRISKDGKKLWIPRAVSEAFYARDGVPNSGAGCPEMVFVKK